MFIFSAFILFHFRTEHIFCNLHSTQFVGELWNVVVSGIYQSVFWFTMSMKTSVDAILSVCGIVGISVWLHTDGIQEVIMARNWLQLPDWKSETFFTFTCCQTRLYSGHHAQPASVEFDSRKYENSLILHLGKHLQEFKVEVFFDALGKTKIHIIYSSEIRVTTMVSIWPFLLVTYEPPVI